MRSARSLLLLPAILALAGFSRAPAAGATLTVIGVYCNNGGGGTFACYADVAGGSGIYTTYSWRYNEYYFNNTYSTQRATTSDPYLNGTCTIGRSVAMSVTVTDSQGATATGTGTHEYCSQWPD